MILTCFFALHALHALQSDVTAIPVQHMRASKMLATIKRLQPDDATVTADDARGVILVKGSLADAKEMLQCISIFDVIRRPVSIAVMVDSRADKMAFETSATILNGQQWSISDKETGLSIGVTPRINDDATVTVLVEIKVTSPGHVQGQTSVVRLKKNGTIALPITTSKADIDALLPTVKITLTKV